MKRQFLICILT
uniref:Uncharacterized protein n=1 Tax=Anguilla anguilla TaxID=7936 RepID=A0A0E9TA69_ANGAN